MEEEDILFSVVIKLFNSFCCLTYKWFLLSYYVSDRTHPVQLLWKANSSCSLSNHIRVIIRLLHYAPTTGKLMRSITCLFFFEYFESWNYQKWKTITHNILLCSIEIDSDQRRSHAICYCWVCLVWIITSIRNYHSPT